jgi:hypothetical protein
VAKHKGRTVGSKWDRDEAISTGHKKASALKIRRAESVEIRDREGRKIAMN